MTVKVGDKVRIVRYIDDLTVGKEYKVVGVDCGDPCVIDDVGERHFIDDRYYTTGAPTATPISTQLRARMEDHMSNGEYVRAVKWAKLAEQAEVLENE